jgi:hypothetical protein
MPRPEFMVLYLGTEQLSGGLTAYVYSVAPGWRIRWAMSPGPGMPRPDDATVMDAIRQLARGLPP